MRPVFPYFEQPIFSIGPFHIAMFQILVCAAVIVGHELVVRRAAARGWDREVASSLIAWTIFLGFVGSHVFDAVLYHPQLVRENPLELFKLWGSMSSFGGIIGGLLGGWWIARHRKLSGRQIFEFLDIVAFVFPFAWIFGRSGCALAHDHVGVATTSWLGVRFPDGTKFDLGLLELLYTFAIAGIFLVLYRKPRPTGFFFGVFFVLYSPVRFVLDTLRTGDERYLGWTPGQYASVAGVLFGLGMLYFLVRQSGAGATPAPAPAARGR
jgi:phosphatidylglycerol:prolipoprotein diacylglycerol transferase